MSEVPLEYSSRENIPSVQDLPTRITTQYGLASNVKAFVQQLSVPDSERKIDVHG